ncbi:MAG: tyrosine-type recombinase/integrase [Euryarchaeota archaeon]|nr:tyrosine-type recombinase/integrase [Euryarchaeota archaeon]
MRRPRAATEPELARFQQELEVQKRSKYTIKQYGLVVASFHRWLSKQRGRDVPLRAAVAADLKQYQIHLTTQRGLAKNTLYHTVKALQAFYKFLGSTNATELKPPRRGQPLPKYLSEAEAARLRQAAKGPRDLALVSLLLFGGLRVGEACRLLVPNIDFHEQTIRIHSGKGDKDRLVVVAPRCLDDLKAWLGERAATSSDYLFPSFLPGKPMTERTAQRIVSQTARAAGLTKKVTPHVLRHTLATTLLRRGGDIRFIQRILGHASIATTQVYTHLDDAELKRMYERARPEF